MATKTPPKEEQALFDEAVANNLEPPSPTLNKNIPSDFGAPNGTPISNKDLLLNDIDRIFGRNKPPAVEYIFVEPYASYQFWKWGLTGNYYGHAAVRYTLPNGESKVMNITGLPDGEMVHFLSAEEYLFGTKEFSNGAEQGGIYNRNMISVRIEDYPPDKVEDLDYYYKKLQRRDKEKVAKFSLLFSPIYNRVSKWLPVSIAERGNCARWTSMGLVESGLLNNPSMWPKHIWVEIFEKMGHKDTDNVHVVSYRRVKHANHIYGTNAAIVSGVKPFNPLTNFLYYNLERFANIIVAVLTLKRTEVPEGQTKAEVKLIENPVEPSWYRYHRKLLSFATVATMYLTWRGYGRWKAGTLFKWNKPRVFTRRYRFGKDKNNNTNNDNSSQQSTSTKQ